MRDLVTRNGEHLLLLIVYLNELVGEDGFPIDSVDVLFTENVAGLSLLS